MATETECSSVHLDDCYESIAGDARLQVRKQRDETLSKTSRASQTV
jgi:hypothetical protein